MSNLVISSDFNLNNPQDFFGSHPTRSNQSTTGFEVNAPDLGNRIFLSGHDLQYGSNGSAVSGTVTSIVCYADNGNQTLFNLSDANINVAYSNNQDWSSFGQELNYWLGSNPTVTTVPGGINGSQEIAAPIGANEVYGYTGHNTLVYGEQASHYSIETNESSDWQVTKSDSSANVNTLHAIQRIAFTDHMVGLDIGAGEISGEAFRIYQAAFDRAPDEGGLGYWIHRLDNGADLTTTVAQSFIDSPEFQQTYGPNVSNNEYITLLYNNVLNRDPDQGGLDFWNGQMSQGMSRASVLVNFSESAENISNTELTVAHGIQYDMWVG